MTYIIFKILFLFVGVLYGTSFFAKAVHKNDIETPMIVIFTVGIVGFLVMQFNLWS